MKTATYYYIIKFEGWTSFKKFGEKHVMLKYRKLQELGVSQNMGMSKEAILIEVMIYGNNCRAKRMCHPTSDLWLRLLKNIELSWIKT